MMFIVLLVCFVVVMLVWLLAMLGAIPKDNPASSWLPWFACLILGVVVFLVGSGVIVVERVR